MPEPDSRPAEILLRNPLPGDLDWVVQRHSEIYADEYKWHGAFEGLVAQIVADFAERGDPTGERCWIATVAGERAGSIFLVRTAEPGVGQLRLLLVEPWARGRGVGNLLVDACIAEARAMGYTRLRLWTNSVLHAARRIYERAGFEMIEATPHQDFGPNEVSQTWELEL